MDERRFAHRLLTGAAVMSMLTLGILAAPATHAQTPMPGGSLTQTGFFATGEFRYLQPLGTNLGYAVIEIDNATATDDTENHDMEYNFAPGLRVGIGWQDNNWDIGAYYSGLWASGDDSAATAVPADDLRPTLGDSTFSVQPSALFDSGSITGDLKVQVMDLEAGYGFAPTSSSGLRIYGGLRYAELDQQLHAVYLNATTRLDTRLDTNFSGAGPRIGMNASVKTGLSNLHVIGNFAGSFLIGTVDAVRDEVQDVSGTLSTSRGNTDELRMIPVIEAELGVAYKVKLTAKRRLNIAAGYRIEDWIGAQDQPESATIVSGREGQRDPGSSDMALHGPYFRVSYMF